MAGSRQGPGPECAARPSMAGTRTEEGQRPMWRATRLIEGEPWAVQGRRIVPVMRLTQARRLGPRGGGGFVAFQPARVVELTPDGERPVPIADQTARRLRLMLLAGLATPLIYGLVKLRGGWR